MVQDDLTPQQIDDAAWSHAGLWGLGMKGLTSEYNRMDQIHPRQRFLVNGKMYLDGLRVS